MGIVLNNINWWDVTPHKTVNIFSVYVYTYVYFVCDLYWHPPSYFNVTKELTIKIKIIIIYNCSE